MGKLSPSSFRLTRPFLGELQGIKHSQNKLNETLSNKSLLLAISRESGAGLGRPRTLFKRCAVALLHHHSHQESGGRGHQTGSPGR